MGAVGGLSRGMTGTNLHFKRITLATPWCRVKQNKNRGREICYEVIAVIQGEMMLAAMTAMRVVTPQREVYSASGYILKVGLLGCADRCDLG